MPSLIGWAHTQNDPRDLMTRSDIWDLGLGVLVYLFMCEPVKIIEYMHKNV